MILVDARPLVALVHADDQWHESCVRALKLIREPMVTVWPAFTEAMYLLGFSWKAQDALWEMVARKAINFLPLDESDSPRIRELMRKYRDRPMDLADAALVRVAEREKVRRVFTVDRADFSIYRTARQGRFTILP